MLIFLVPFEALGQNVVRRDSVTIKIERVDGVCTYDILDQDNDDRFIVGPDSPISFEAVGVRARVEFSRADSRSRNSKDQGKRGVRGDQRSSFEVTSAKKERTRSRRKFAPREGQSRGRGVRTTSHTVFINCLNQNGDEDENASRSRNPSVNGGGGGSAALMAPRFQHEMIGEQIYSGPSDFAIPLSMLGTPPLIESRRRGEGGPAMQVEDP
ncbi:MAG: hypothetical protein BMS9Abin05_2021 [Rhodothermia bacterium]|nr:MAG: hypothetical protein BMS9Abin05_2021 [Rhodothermia bacterium]